MSRVEWDTLTFYAKEKAYAGSGQRTVSELIENVQRVLDDPGLGPLQKAVVEALVVRESATETAKRITATSGVIGPLATIGRAEK